MAMVHYGGYAEEVVALATLVYFIPNSIGYTAAAVFPTSSSTSHIGICDKLKLQAGKTILIHGAAGGVGLTAVEIAKKVDATVIATAGGPKKLAIAKQHGADHLIDYRTEDIRTRVKALTDGRGVEGV
jgi:NADPH2:quinone reductase